MRKGNGAATQSLFNLRPVIAKRCMAEWKERDQSCDMCTKFRYPLFVFSAVAALAALTASLFCLAEEKGRPLPNAPQVSFEKQIRPVLEEKCVHCHNQETLPDRISFENAKLAFAMTKDGKVYIVPGKPEASLLIAAIEAPLFHEKQMPMVGERLTEEEKSVFRRWVAEGAKWPVGKAGNVKVTFRAIE